MSFGHCPPDQLCDACLEAGLATHRGTAARRGEVWGAERARDGAATAAEDDRELLEALALRRVHDLASDAVLRGKLAAIALWYAVPSLRQTVRAW